MLRSVAGLIASSALVGLLGVTPAAYGQEQPLVVQGRVANATPGGSSVEGLTAVLHEESSTRHDHLETTTDVDGRFGFDGIMFDPMVAYGVSVRYQGALYGTDLDLSGGSPANVPLTVYDGSSSDEMLSVSSASVLFARVDQSTQTVAALEIMRIVNDSDLAYVPGPKPMDLLRFGLPAGAQGLQVDSALLGADFVQVDRGFGLVASVPPGEHEVMLSYQFPYSESRFAFEKSFPYGAKYLRVLAPSDVLELSSGELGNAQAVIIGERPYELLEARDLGPGARVSVDLEGLPTRPLTARVGRRLDGVRLEYVAPVGLGLFMLVLIAYALKKRSNERRQRLHETPAAEINEERRTVIQMIADLEHSLQAGTLDESEYRRIRVVLDSRLGSLTAGG